jgi:hypothetical protein
MGHDDGRYDAEGRVLEIGVGSGRNGSQIDNCCSILIGGQPLRNADEIQAIQQQTTSSRWVSILEAN